MSTHAPRTRASTRNASAYAPAPAPTHTHTRTHARTHPDTQPQAHAHTHTRTSAPTRKTPAGNALSASVLDNKETFLQLSSLGKGEPEQKKAFITAYYKKKNLRLADKLEKSELKDNETVNTAIRYLRYCGSLAIVEVMEGNVGSIFKVSKSCKNPHCALCARTRSNKLATRFIAVLKDDENKDLFQDVRFYFLTLTLKHNEGLRQEVYLEELNRYCNQLYKSKVWKESFEKGIDIKKTGRIHTKECTFSKGQYHIHAHIIIAGSKLKNKVKEVEESIRGKWQEITTDSYIVRLDLIKNRDLEKAGNESGLNESNVMAALKELFKYGSKSGALAKWSNDDVMKYAKWIIETKGKNFVNVSGVFRGFKLTSAKCKYDMKVESRELSNSCKYFVSKTSQLIFSKATNLDYTAKKRKEVEKEVYLKKIPDSAFEITDCVESMLTYMSVGIQDKELENFLPEWIEYSKKEGKEKAEAKLILEREERKKANRKMKKEGQLKIFGHTHTHTHTRT